MLIVYADLIKKYNAGKLNVFFNYDNYMRNDNIDSIQAIIKALGIDSEDVYKRQTKWSFR